MMQKLFDEKIERRDKVQVLADILQVARESSKTTTILRLANLQYNKFLECRDILCEAGLLREIKLNDEGDSNSKCLYKTTNLGKKWSRKVNRVYAKIRGGYDEDIAELNEGYWEGGEALMDQRASKDASNQDFVGNESPDLLVVDDEPDIRNLLKIFLKERDYDVTTAKNGAEAIEKAEKTHPELVLLDIIMPGRTGFDVCKDLKLKKSTEDIPVVMYSVLNRWEDKEMAREAGADDFITKSVRPEKILQTVESYMPKNMQYGNPINIARNE